MKFYNRDLSWLSFNHRVLQEAKDERNPLLERLKFLAIFSSNLDEFYRVRVAALRSLIRSKKNKVADLGMESEDLLKKITSIVDKQQEEFGNIFKDQLLPQLSENNIFIINENNLNPKRFEFIQYYFKKKVLDLLNPEKLSTSNKTKPFIENSKIYLAIKVKKYRHNRFDHFILKVPIEETSRFIVLPEEEKHLVIRLEDVIRWNLNQLFPKSEVVHCYSFKLSRDAELYLEDEFDENIVNKIEKSLKKRHSGLPSRFLYDKEMPKSFLNYLLDTLPINSEDLVPGGRYHNFSDFFGFPEPDNTEGLEYPKQPPLNHPAFVKNKKILDIIDEKDVLMHFPYQNYNYVVDFLKEAAEDEDVTEIKITLYRVASNSKVAKALIKAAKNGKKVFVFDEVKARFDEQSNIYWGDKLEKEGVKVLYDYNNLKVHTKIALVTKVIDDVKVNYAYLGTGNFNEKTANIYCDHGLLTKNQDLTKELEKVFDILENGTGECVFNHLLVAPFNLRSSLENMIDREIMLAKKGKNASITFKMNSLEDKKMIKKLYEANNAGVKIKLIIRGICCLIPGVEGMSENIKVTSIIDRYLEHARVYIFNNNGNKEVYVASADCMSRNLNRRVEVGFPIYDKSLRDELLKIIAIQLADNTKARKINQKQTNPYKISNRKVNVRAQYDLYDMLKNKLN